MIRIKYYISTDSGFSTKAQTVETESTVVVNNGTMGIIPSDGGTLVLIPVNSVVSIEIL